MLIEMAGRQHSIQAQCEHRVYSESAPFHLSVETCHSLKSRPVAYVVTLLWPTTGHIRVRAYGERGASKNKSASLMFTGGQSPSLSHVGTSVNPSGVLKYFVPLTQDSELGGCRKLPLTKAMRPSESVTPFAFI